MGVGCFCSGNPSCEKCDGTGVQQKVSCSRCGGTAFEPGHVKCVNCRGLGWRALDQTEWP